MPAPIQPDTTFRDETIALLNNRSRRLTLDKIAEDVGVSKRWLVRVAKGEIENPGVVSITTLKTYLLNNKT